MLTEPQFKVLMILFDDKGHPGWQLAEDLDMKESNLNHYLKDLEKRKFIIQGLPRKSTKPRRREGDYKEYPYYLNRDLQILGSIIEEMVVTNKVYDTGFPFRIIRASNYIKSIKKLNEWDINEFLATLSRDLQIIEIRCLEATKNITQEITQEIERVLGGMEEEPEVLHLNSFSEGSPSIKDRRVSKKLLKELEVWWLLYNLRRCCSQDPIDVEEVFKIMHDDILDDYLLGDDIIEVIYEAVKRVPDHENLPIWEYLNDWHNIFYRDRDSSQDAVF